ncbi:MAG: ABC transporter ATP-binding protein [Verrucomicrobiales bacterium]|jgi:subfamily B ATP-binding cassette protein MsbA|nr:ABC transporter ATP-binding protein [Verrucomicrobiales bacterium]
MKAELNDDKAKRVALDSGSSVAGPYRRLAAYLKPYKWRFIFGIIFGALYGVVNGGMVLVINYVTNIVFGASKGPEDFEEIKNKLPPEEIDKAQEAFEKVQGIIQESAGNAVQFDSHILLVALLIPAIMVIRGLFGFLNSYCMLWCSLRVLSDIRVKLFRRLMGQSLDYFNQSKGGELMQTVFNQTRLAQQTLTTAVSDIVKQPVAIISALAAIFYIDWQFALCALVLFPICIVPVIIAGRKVRKSGRKEEDEAEKMMVVMQEAISGIQVVKGHAREEHEIGKFVQANSRMMTFIMRWRKAMEIVSPLVEIVASFGVGAALVYCSFFPGSGGPGKFLALNAGLVLLYPPAKSMSRISVLLQKSLAATAKVFKMMDRAPSIQDADDAVEIEDCKGEIRFENVSHSYGEEVYAVEEIDFTVEAGKNYALVGESGAGKSTLFSLILRFYDPRDGIVSIDGVDIRNIRQESLRDHIGVVNQDTFLFHDSIYENIRYGKLDATKEEVIEAAKMAHAHEFIIDQEQGYDTIVGDKGDKLSGGQKQRISIARAILRDAPILLLDEATSALDSRSEKVIQEALQKLSKGRTSIAIAHRLSTILNADRIVVMERGRISAIGSHSELLDSSDTYQHLYRMQFGHDGASADYEV